MTNKDDFLTQIEDTEKKAAKILIDAREKGQALLTSIKKEVAADFKTQIDRKRSSIKLNIVSAQSDAKHSYKKKIAEAQKSVDSFKKEQQQKLDKTCLQAQSFFLTELL